MSVVPDPLPLDPPAGSPEAVDDAARATAAAGHLLDELTDRLVGARATAWHGADADATEARRGRIARMAGDGADALHRIAVRLAGHADVLREVQARLAVLRAAQDDEFAVARSRVALPLDPADPLAEHPSDVLARLRAAEADRAAEHVRLSARADDDAAETGRLLAGAAALVAGTPRYDSDTALLRLAALLPAWGTPEVARRGYLLARAVRDDGDDGEGMGTEELQAAAREDLDLATDPAYAAAFLAALPPRIATAWLVTAWGGAPADDPRTDLMARVLSGLDRGSVGPPWLAGLLDDARETGELGAVAGGLGAVLARAKATGLTGPPPTLAAAWTRSLLQEERATGHPTDLGVLPAGADPAASDPLALLAEAMVEQRAALEAARAMSDPDAWAVVLSRTWNDPALRDALVDTVADAPPEAAGPALRDALVALGTGLEDGDPADWAFFEEQIPTVAPTVVTALLRHPDVLVGPLAAATRGTVDSVSATALRGLAVVVTFDEANVAHVGERIASALSGPHPVALSADEAAAGAASAAFVAVREHGARLAHVMEQFRRKATAEAKAEVWGTTFGIGFTLAGAVPKVGLLASPVETVVTHVLGTDGSYTNSPDRQRHHSGLEAVMGAVAGAEASGQDRGAVARGAMAAYERTLHALGTPVAPVAPSDNLAEKLRDAAVEDIAGEVVGGWLPFVPEDLRGTVGGVLVDAGSELAGGSD